MAEASAGAERPLLVHIIKFLRSIPRLGQYAGASAAIGHYQLGEPGVNLVQQPAGILKIQAMHKAELPARLITPHLMPDTA